MTRGLIVILVVVLVLACIFVNNIQLGQASNQIEEAFERHIEISEEYLVSIQYHLNPKDPSCVGLVHLEILTIPREKPINQVLISLDQGFTWFECSKFEKMVWKCDLSSSLGINIKDFKVIQVVVN